MGSVKRTANGTWRARVWIAGRQVGRSFPRQEDARAWVGNEPSADKRRGAWLDPALARTPFREVAEAYLEGVAHLAPSSRLRTEGIIDGHLLPRLGGRPVGSLTPTHVKTLMRGALRLRPGAGVSGEGLQRAPGRPPRSRGARDDRTLTLRRSKAPKGPKNTSRNRASSRLKSSSACPPASLRGIARSCCSAATEASASASWWGFEPSASTSCVGASWSPRASWRSAANCTGGPRRPVGRGS